jgi:hypothetical protein
MSLAEAPQLPSPDQQQAIQAQEARQPKTEQEISDQIGRIAGKLGDRVMALVPPENASQYSARLTDTDTVGNSVTSGIYGNESYMQVKTVDEDKPQSVTVADVGGGLTKLSYKYGESDDAPVARAGIQIRNGIGELVGKDDRSGPVEFIAKLDKKQTIHAAAGILAGARNELSGREKAKKAEAVSAVDASIEDVLKA